MGGLNSLASVGLNLALGQQAMRQESKEAKAERDRQIAAIMRSSSNNDKLQANALRRRLASERVRAGAAGTATTGGSIDAILRGLEREAEQDAQARREATAQKVKEINDAFGVRRNNNLLTTTNRLLGSISGSNSSSSSRRSLLG
ncbi:MAG: hypothetical protein KDG49_20625 [Geminicoccaceae bacterium]|jgi:hypothetical protein|nr:hypothetical protein [Rhodospirillales bacterium]MCB1993865.1 hypothetical protein [Geminicoccaceae bacterium]